MLIVGVALLAVLANTRGVTLLFVSVDVLDIVGTATPPCVMLVDAVNVVNAPAAAAVPPIAGGLAR